MIDISLIASSVRPHLWEECFESLAGNNCKFEVVFSGNLDTKVWLPFREKYPFLRYIQTENIKPAQNYEIARQAAFGTFTMWIADDCEFSPKLLDKIVMEMDGLPHKTLLSVKTNENGTCNNLDDHRFFDGFQDPNHTSPLMAPLGVIRTAYLQELGGFDRRYLCGQYENDVAMRVFADGGDVVKFEEVCVFIDHIRKHGQSTKFWSGYNHDRKILEDTWAIGGYKEVVHEYEPLPSATLMEKGAFFFVDAADDADAEQMRKEINLAVKSKGMHKTMYRIRTKYFDRKVSPTPLLPFEPYTPGPLIYESQSHKGDWK